MTDQTPFRYRFRVRYGECDAQGVVFNARYGDYVDIAVTEFQRPVWGGLDVLLRRGLDMQVVKQTLEWSSPARFDDVLEARVRAVRLGTTSMTLRTEVAHLPSGRAVLTAETVYVLVDAQSLTKMPIPEDMRDRLFTGAPGVVVNHAGYEPG